MKEIEQINKNYYDKLYKKRGFFSQLIYPFISYDQQCKSKYNNAVIRNLLRNHHDDFVFLDYGFGHGSLLLKMPNRAKLYGCDLSVEAVVNFPKVAAKLGKKVTTFLPEELDTVTGTTQFDLISLSHVIEHVDDDAALLKLLASRLAVNGRLLVNIPINEVWTDPKHVRKYSLEYMISLAHRCNLKIEDWREAERWSAYFLEIEKVKKSSRLAVMLQRGARLFLALLPVPLLKSSETLLLPDKYKNQQLILLLSK
jgi:2-polyprenyl-3-methyl-5-hydroxy-6-metoxy-1,4-benzoquinol methylase